jgi:hypothetical protein
MRRPTRVTTIMPTPIICHVLDTPARGEEEVFCVGSDWVGFDDTVMKFVEVRTSGDGEIVADWTPWVVGWMVRCCVVMACAFCIMASDEVAARVGSDVTALVVKTPCSTVVGRVRVWAALESEGVTSRSEVVVVGSNEKDSCARDVLRVAVERVKACSFKLELLRLKISRLLRTSRRGSAAASQTEQKPNRTARYSIDIGVERPVRRASLPQVGRMEMG